MEPRTTNPAVLAVLSEEESVAAAYRAGQDRIMALREAVGEGHPGVALREAEVVDVQPGTVLWFWHGRSEVGMRVYGDTWFWKVVRRVESDPVQWPLETRPSVIFTADDGCRYDSADALVETAHSPSSEGG